MHAFAFGRIRSEKSASLCQATGSGVMLMVPQPAHLPQSPLPDHPLSVPAPPSSPHAVAKPRNLAYSRLAVRAAVRAAPEARGT